MRQKNVPARRRALADAARDPAGLPGLLRLDPSAVDSRAAADGRFPLGLPRSYAARIRPVDPADPLLARVLPRAAEVAAAARHLPAAGATLLNQSVLLAGVNDTAPALAELSRRLFAFGTLPYYVHLLDPVRGAAPFDVPAASARVLLADLATRLPGYLVPRLVCEEPGRPGKTPLAFDWPADARNHAG